VVAIPATLPRDRFLTLELPALEAVGVALGTSTAAVAVAGLAGLALLTSWNALFFAATLVFDLLARSGALPLPGRAGPLGRSVPVMAITAGSVLLSLAGRTAVESIVTFVSLCMTLVFLTMGFGLWRVERRDLAGPGRTLVPALGVASSSGLALLGAGELSEAWSASPLGTAIVGVWLAAGVAIGLNRRRAGLTFRTTLGA
jgi:amino acid transporter